MPSSVSDPPTRWDYSTAELEDLAPELRPTEPPPQPEPCACGQLVEARWVPPKVWAGLSSALGGYWSRGHTCAGCAANQETAAQARRLAELVEAAQLPRRYSWANFELC